MELLSQILTLLFQLIFGAIAIKTQAVALSKKAELVHALAWSVEVLLSSAAFLILAVFGSPIIATVSFILGIIMIAIAVAIFK